METIQKLKEVLLTLFPVRRSAAQKEEFRKWLIKEMKRAGHKAVEEKYGKLNGSVNVIAGDPEKATVFLTAHYDTAARMLLPNYVSPTNPFLHVGYHVGAGILLVLVALVMSFAVTFPVDQPELTFPLFIILTVAGLLLTAYGPANRNNANSNTSGVLALLAMANSLNKDERVCFVFFDNNERSLLGAKAFKQKHAVAADRALFINFDCVGNGDEMLFLPSKHSRWDGELLDALSDAYRAEGEIDPRVVSQGLVYYPSDNRKFKFHVAVVACKRKPFLGCYIPYLNSRKDTILNCENIRFLADGMERFLPMYFAQGEEK